MKFTITKTWDSSPVTHREISLSLKPDDEGLLMEVEGPFFNDPSAPPGKRGKPYDQLWDFEVVEAFFLNSSKELYLEVELCPHGQHLVLLLAGKGKAWKKELDLKYDCTIHEQNWEGKALLPWSYFPPGVNKFNAYAIHGSGDNRVYEALYPIPKEQLKKGQQPDFHRLEYFKDFSLNSVMGKQWKQPQSELWKSAPGTKKWLACLDCCSCLSNLGIRI
ncbi:UPF0462 protein C4orf33 homolog isoform X1 [Carcharodon carcharias]|uniref:UPF0462 protein C4orf33 homolog isoform X1 n=2 Tax=Carcharodon carcharias TaxID=13397 RepID=UPI001B7E58C9|nr:UPF0462 protein C4orf33 homolog isoform X1 [Carcharodon carcharias]